jgi:hypothetical protein
LSLRPSPTRRQADDSSPWARERAQGRTNFIWRRGVLGWGIPAAVAVVLYKTVQEQGVVLTPQLTDSLKRAIGIAIVVFPFAGWLFGRWLWDTSETRYRTRMRDEEPRR